MDSTPRPEEWRPVAGYEGIYEVSNTALVRRVDGKPQARGITSMRQRLDRKYNSVLLTKNRKQHMFFVHRLVAIAFIPNPENKPFVNHKDANKKNNLLENLEWCTRMENARHAVQLGLYKINHVHGEAHWCSKLNESSVREIISLKKQGVGDRTVGKMFGVSGTLIRVIRRRLGWLHVWRKIDQESQLITTP